MTIKIQTIVTGYDNVYCVRDQGAILVDAGSPGKFAQFEAGLAKLGVAPQKIRLVVLTHAHWDHIGCAAAIKRLTAAPLVVHEAEASRVESGQKAMPPGTCLWGKVFGWLCRSVLLPPLSIEGAAVDVRVTDEGMSLEPYGIPGRLLHTPGHSPGSLSLLLDSGDALVGDLGMNQLPLRLGPGLPIFAEEPQKLRASIEMLLAQGAKTVYPAHGAPFSIRILEQSLHRLPA